MSDTEEAARHRAKMEKRKAVQDAEVASKTIEKGLLLVNTGPGKGKSTAAFGLLLRMLGHGRPCGVVQFIKGAWSTGERQVLEGFGPLVEWHSMGEGFTWETQDRAQDIAAARAAWERSKEMILDPAIDFVILDELNIVLRDDTLPIAEIVAFLKDRPLTKHICITGRNAKPELLELADLVTEFGEVKHPYHAGFKAQKGVEY